MYCWPGNDDMDEVDEIIAPATCLLVEGKVYSLDGHNNGFRLEQHHSLEYLHGVKRTKDHWQSGMKR